MIVLNKARENFIHNSLNVIISVRGGAYAIAMSQLQCKVKQNIPVIRLDNPYDTNSQKKQLYD